MLFDMKKAKPCNIRTQLIATIWTGFNEYSRFKGFLLSNSSFQTTFRFGNQICRRSDSWIWHLHLPQRVKKTETSNIRRIQISDRKRYPNGLIWVLVFLPDGVKNTVATHYTAMTPQLILLRNGKTKRSSENLESGFQTAFHSGRLMKLNHQACFNFASASRNAVRRPSSITGW